MKHIKFIIILFVAVLFSSCLKHDLDDLPAFDEAEIVEFKFEYRWLEKNGEYDQLRVKQLNVVNPEETEPNVIKCEIVVPDEDADFPIDIRDQVSLSNIVGYAEISNAATIKPIGDSPVLGKVADFSAESFDYKVTAADGSSEIWTVEIVSFIK